MEIENLIVEKVALLDLEIRTRELDILSYTSTLLKLPTGDIPSDVVEYINIPVNELPVDMEYDDISLISKYKYRNYLQTELRITSTEKEKAELMRQSLYAQLPTDTRDQLILDAATMLATQTPAA